MGVDWRGRSRHQEPVLLGVRLLMSYEVEQRERAMASLKELLNKVPARVTNAGVMETRAWVQARQEAEKLMKKRGVTTAELLGMADRLK
jgi:hypothetical protein